MTWLKLPTFIPTTPPKSPRAPQHPPKHTLESVPAPQTWRKSKKTPPHLYMKPTPNTKKDGKEHPPIGSQGPRYEGKCDRHGCWRHYWRSARQDRATSGGRRYNVLLWTAGWRSEPHGPEAGNEVRRGGRRKRNRRRDAEPREPPVGNPRPSDHRSPHTSTHMLADQIDRKERSRRLRNVLRIVGLHQRRGAIDRNMRSVEGVKRKTNRSPPKQAIQPPTSP